MIKCEYESCPCEATHSITFNIPAEGVPIDLHRPIKMYIGVRLCLEHAKIFGKDFDWDDNLPMQEAIDASLAETSSTKADYSRTFHSIVKLTDPGYLQFLEFMAARE